MIKRKQKMFNIKNFTNLRKFTKKSFVNLKNINPIFNKANLFNFSNQQAHENKDLETDFQLNTDSINASALENQDRDLLMLSKQEKVFSKVLMRNIKYYSSNSQLHDSIANKLISTFNFSEENDEGDKKHFLVDDTNAESDLIYSTSKSFYVDWANSDFSQGKVVLRIKAQSKNIIFEDLFNSIENVKDENSLFVVNFDGRSAAENEENELFSDSEEILNSNKNMLDYPRELLEEPNKDRRKFDVVYNFDTTKPNQLLFFCEKLFVNDIISARELSEIKQLAFVANRNLKYSQDQNRLENQYDSVAEAFGDIRIMQKLERLDETSDLKVVFDLNLLYWRPDHKIDAKIKLPKTIENKYIYVISDKENLEFLSKVPGITKLDNGEFFEEFVSMIDKNSYNKKFKLFIAKNNLEIITQKAEIYERFEAKAPGFQNHIRNNEEEIIAEVTDVQENKINVCLGKDNKINVNLGDLTLSNENLIENFGFLKKQILKLKPSTVNKKNYLKNASLYINNVEFRLKNKE